MPESLVSVIIPVYNTENFLTKCLSSVIDQSYKNIEIIAIDDGSTDDSLSILREFECSYPCIKVFSQPNMGNSVARNKGIKEASGKYIYFLDSDDYILENTLEELVLLMEQYNLDIVRFAAEPFIDGNNLNLQIGNYDFGKYFSYKKIYNKKEFLNVNLKAFWPSVVLYLIKKDLILNNNIKFKQGILHEDDLFSLEIFLNSEKAMYVPKKYYKRRYRANSIMTSINNEDNIRRSFDSYLIVANEMNNLFNKHTDKSEIKLIKSRLKSIFNTLLNKDVEANYKKSNLLNYKGISRQVHNFYKVRYKIKKVIKNV